MLRRFAAFALGCLLLSACSETAPPADQAASPDPPQVAIEQRAAESIRWSEQVHLVPVNFTEWRAELEAMRGNIVVVDHWATWCAPCLERFPKMMEMAREWEPKGVQFVTLSLDDRDDPDSIAQVQTFLEQQDARLPNYLMDEIIPDAFEKLDLLGIPAVLIYDRDGQLRHRLTGDDPNRQYTDADVERAIREMVEGP
ncbi:MAG TPA: TlpA disulfide reductase family protein [Thermoanaerobaculia bacterium]|nr:TlpA disulfide reductase family protein [Thermoanaerobaculia bacterium]